MGGGRKEGGQAGGKARSCAFVRGRVGTGGERLVAQYRGRGQRRRLRLPQHPPHRQDAVERHRRAIEDDIVCAAVAGATAIGVPLAVAVAVVIAFADVVAAAFILVGVRSEERRVGGGFGRPV